jgi:hypothetical protein
MKIKWLALGALMLLLGGCQRATWREFSSKEGRFSVLVPGTLSEQTQNLTTQAGAIDLHFFVVEQDGFQYLVSYNDYPDAMVREANADKVLDGARDGVVANVQGRLLNEAKVWLADYPGRELRIKIPEGRQAMRTRLYFVGNRLYQVGVLSAEDGAAAEEIGKFLNSFKLLTP